MAYRSGEVTQPSDLILDLSAAERRNMFGYIVKPYNFLKHADRDPLATPDEDDIDPDGAIAHALAVPLLPGSGSFQVGSMRFQATATGARSR